MTANYNNIPKELKKRNQWVCWKKEDKCPVNPRTGKNACSDDPGTWGSFNDAVKYSEAHQGNGIGGIGFTFSENDPYCGVDGDHCRDKTTLTIEPQTADELTKLNTYSEISPSGEGVHAVVKGKLPGAGLGPKEGRLFEMYDKGRYFTFTGHWLGEFGGHIEDRTAEILELYKRMEGGSAVNSTVESVINGVKKGARNQSCASVAGSYLYQGYTVKETLKHCLEWNKKNDPPLNEQEIEKNR